MFVGEGEHDVLLLHHLIRLPRPIPIMAYSAALKRSQEDSVLTDMKMSHDVVLQSKGRSRVYHNRVLRQRYFLPCDERAVGC